MSKKSIIYLAGDRLLLLQGKASAKKVTITGYWQQPLAEGTMLNGVVTDAAAFGEGLAALRAAAGKAAARAQLVVDSSQIMAKALAAPAALKQKQLLNIVRSELSELDSAARDLVYDYAQLPPVPGIDEQQLLCCGAERSAIQQFCELFGAANIRLTGITSALGSCLRMVEFLPELAGQSFVLCVLDGQTVVTYLFAGGRYLMNSRSRLITERGSSAVLSELLGRVSSMLQFSQSHKTAEPAKTVYFGGLLAEETPGCQLIADTFGVQALPLPGFSQVTALPRTRFAFSDAFAAVGALVPSKRRGLDFLLASQNKQAPTGMEKKSVGLPWAVPILLAVLLAGGCGLLLWQNYQLAGQIAQIRLYTQNEENLAALAQVQTDRAFASNYTAAAAEAQRAIDILQATLQPDEALLRQADSAAGEAVTFKGYQYNAGSDLLTFDCWTADYREIPDFILRMQNTGYYINIGYTGYTQAGEQGAGGYAFTISCTVKGAE